MKKLILFTMILVLLLSITACDLPGADNSDSSDPTGSSVTSDPTGNSDPSEPSEPSEPSVPSEPSEPTEITEPHEHAYNLTKTTNPKCEQKGENTYTCKCGDSYTEEIAATGHTWKDWVTDIEPTFTTTGTAKRGCKNCTEKETKQLEKSTIEQEMQRLAGLVDCLPEFQSVDQLSGGLIFDWACNGAGYISSEWSEETYLVTRIYSLDALNAFTTTYMGKTFDFLYLLEYNDYMTYDEENNQLILTLGAAGGGYEMCYDSYEKIDDTHYKLRYYAADYDGSVANYGNVNLLLTETGFIFESHAEEH